MISSGPGGPARSRRILDQLDQLLRRRPCPASRRGCGPGRRPSHVRHAEPPPVKIGQQIARSVGQAGTVGFNALRSAGGIGRQEQGRARRIDQLAQVECQAASLIRIEGLVVGLPQQMVGRRDVDLLEQTKIGVLLPFRGVKPAVGFGAGTRRGRGAAAGGGSPDNLAAAASQVSAICRDTVMARAAPSSMARTGSLRRRCVTVANASVIAPQSIGNSLCRGLSSHS